MHASDRDDDTGEERELKVLKVPHCQRLLREVFMQILQSNWGGGVGIAKEINKSVITRSKKYFIYFHKHFFGLSYAAFK